MNNLASSIFDVKVDRMCEQVNDDYSRWFANYLNESAQSPIATPSTSIFERLKPAKTIQTCLTRNVY